MHLWQIASRRLSRQASEGKPVLDLEETLTQMLDVLQQQLVDQVMDSLFCLSKEVTCSR